MRLVAGVDVGNATTEVVVADVSGSSVTPVAWDRRPTRGRKGTEEATAMAAQLLARLERRLGQGVDDVVLTPQEPVTSRTVGLARPSPATGRLRVHVRDARTPAGRGAGAGVPVAVEEEPRSGASSGPVVLVAREVLDFRGTSAAVRRWVEAGADVRAVLLAGDEARLVAARVPGFRGPVVDGVDADAVLGAERVAVEVADVGSPLRQLVDPVWLSAALPAVARDDALVAGRAVAAELAGARAGVVGLHASVGSVGASPAAGLAAEESARAWVEVAGERWPLLERAAELAGQSVGSVSRLCLPPVEPSAVRDLGVADLDGGAVPALRPGALARHRLGLASLPPATTARSWPDPLRAGGRRVHLAPDETGAALAGAMSTPGAGREVTVVDLGGGTLDLLAPGSAVSAAGCGDLLTEVVAAVLGVSRGAAEWVKRAPSVRVEDPHVVADETGARHFLDEPAPSGSVGWLTVPGPSGPLPFSAELVPAEWRLTRQALKRLTIAASLARAVAAHGRPLEGVVLLAGGPAGDDELLDLLRVEHPTAVLGRVDAAGGLQLAGGVSLGTRYAVAHGLVLLHAAGATTQT